MVVESELKPKMAFIVNRAKEELSSITGLQPSTVLGIEKEADNWRVSIEMIEKKSIPDLMDILGNYEVHLDSDGQVLGFNRISLRKRGDIVESIYKI